jgi:hypothetical protein
MSDEEFFPRDNRQPRHFWADNEVFDVFGPKLGAYGIAVYMALARSAMNNSGECRTSMRKIANQIGTSPASVFNALSVILQLGLARKTDDGDNRRCATYVLADVKALTDPNHAQLRLSGSVHLINAGSGERSIGERSVQSVNPSVQSVNPAFNRRTRHKEDKTLQDYKTISKQDPPPLSSKGGTKPLTARQLKLLREHIAFFECVNGKDGKMGDAADPNCQRCKGQGTWQDAGNHTYACPCRWITDPTLSPMEIAAKAAAKLVLPLDRVIEALRNSGRDI